MVTYSQIKEKFETTETMIMVMDAVAHELLNQVGLEMGTVPLNEINVVMEVLKEVRHVMMAILILMMDVMLVVL